MLVIFGFGLVLSLKLYARSLFKTLVAALPETQPPLEFAAWYVNPLRRDASARLTMNFKQDVIVPGGQYIYALPNGEIGYTKPHSGFAPLDSIVCPFNYTTDGAANWEGVGHLSADATRAFGAHGLQACPSDDGRYQVLLDFSNSTGSNVNRTGCLPFVALAVDYTQGVAAWEYT
jgi:hypothetical protein